MEKFPLWTAIITPMDYDGKIDYESFESIIRKQEEANNGVLFFGSTGEGLNLTSTEKREVITFVKKLDLKVPIMAGLGGHDLSSQISFIQYCDEVGVDAFLLVTPIYAKPGKAGQLAWFKELMSQTKTKCMVYNVPSRTGVHLNPEVPAQLFKEFDNYMGLKEASGDVEKFKAFRDAAPAAPLYCGDDSLIKEFTDEGAIGLVSVASNAWPKQTHKFLELHLNKQLDSVFTDWIAQADLFFDAPSPIPVKTLMQHKGWITTNTVRLPLSTEDLKVETEEALLEADRKINLWIKKVTK